MGECGWEITEVVSGGCRGVDWLGEEVAQARGIPLEICRAEWGRHGRAAGPIRNQKMADYADALVAVWDCKSKGTADMIRRAHKSGLRVFVLKVCSVCGAAIDDGLGGLCFADGCTAHGCRPLSGEAKP